MTRILYARDEAGNEHRVIQRLEAAEGEDAHGGARMVYTLEDGSPVRRVESETFQIVSTGAYISAVEA